MKYFLIVTALILSAFTATAQTNPITGFLGSTLDYFSSNNTNFTFTPFKLWTEIDYQNQINFADSIDFSYDVYQPASYTNGIAFDLEASMRNSGVAGTIVSYQGGGAVAYNLYAIRVEGYVDGGYNEVFHKGYGELGARLLKKPTENTILGLTLAFQVPTHGPSYPIVGVVAGATF